MVASSNTAFFLGWAISAIPAGAAGNRYGRRIPLALALSSLAVTLALTTLATGPMQYVTAKLFHGFAIGAAYTFNFVYSTEFFPSAYSAAFGTIYFIITALARTVIFEVAWVLPNWRVTSLVIAGPTLLAALWPLVSPESPAWLLSVGKEKAATAVLTDIAEENGSAPPELALTESLCAEGGKDAQKKSGDPAGSQGCMTLLSPEMRTSTISMAACWFGVSFIFYGLNLGGTTLPGDPYTNGAILTAVEMPVYPLALVFMDRPSIGRKGTAIGPLLVACVCCIACAFPIGQAARWIAFVGIMFLTAAFGDIYVWAAEVFPPEVRTSAIGVCSAAGKAGSMLAPFAVMIAGSSLSQAMLVYAFIAAVSLWVSSLLPETLTAAKPQPESLEKDKKNSDRYHRD